MMTGASGVVGTNSLQQSQSRSVCREEQGRDGAHAGAAAAAEG